ncbi:MAG: hypothetical protein Q9220_000471 [cf. Caloplaca sp. 1 TL-2023]
MGCCGDREKLEDARAEAKWGYINLRDFRSTSCYSPLSYGILYIFLVISVAVYAVDIFTAANLLFFDRWSGQVKPVISFNIARWIFAACILLSLVLLAYRLARALRVIKSGVVAASYLDPLAVRIQSIRPGARGQGWRRFLVFAALTEGRKGAEYVALFTYFSFEAWMRIVFAEGPRQLLNAQTLYSVMQANLVPAGGHAAKDGQSSISQFWTNLGILATHNREQAAILFGMLFTLVIWLFSVLGLLLACIFYLVFLWHHIPDSDGSLSRYCRRKIDTRLAKIVSVKIDKALAREERLRAGGGAKGSKGTKEDRPPQVKRQPTIPLVEDDHELLESDASTRRSTQSTFSSDPSRQDTGLSSRQPTLPDVSSATGRPQAPSRTTTQSSSRTDLSYGSDAPLIGSAGEMGYGQPGRSYSRPPPSSRNASSSSRPYGYPFAQRNPSTGSYGTERSYNTTILSRPPPGRMASDSTGRVLSRQNTDTSLCSPSAEMQNFAGQGRQSPFDPPILHSSAAPTQDFEMRSQLPRGPSPGQYVAYNPNLHNQQQQRTAYPPRNFTLPARPPPSDDYSSSRLPPPFPRSGTAPLPPLPLPTRSGTAPIPQVVPYEDPMYVQDEYGNSRRPSIPMRAATAGPEMNGPARNTNWQRKPVTRPPY